MLLIIKFLNAPIYISFVFRLSTKKNRFHTYLILNVYSIHFNYKPYISIQLHIHETILIPESTSLLSCDIKYLIIASLTLRVLDFCWILLTAAG
jgi:hypothetical protein